jgi:hypothetical protein
MAELPRTGKPKGVVLMRAKTRFVLLAALAGVLALWALFASPARAGVYNRVSIQGTTAADTPALGGTVVHDQTVPFTVTGHSGQTLFSGTIQDQVVRESGTGHLDFLQVIRADASQAKSAVFDFLRRSGFGNFSTAVGFRTDAGGQSNLSPERAYRSKDGSTVQVSFNDKINASGVTRTSFVRTDATAFDLTGNTELSFIGQDHDQASAFVATAQPVLGTGSTGGGAAPTAAVPLPAAVALFPMGAVAALWAGRRMRRRG